MISIMADSLISELTVATERIILTNNAKDFRPPLKEDYPGLIGIPETWSIPRFEIRVE